MTRKYNAKRRTKPEKAISIDNSAMGRLLADIRLQEADKSFTQHDHDMAQGLLGDSQSMARFYCTFNDSADGNNPAEVKR